jgi:dTDP-4-amino-4,6-dideoxygalactose transaminase
MTAIPFRNAVAVGREAEYITQVIASSQFGNDGIFAARCGRLLEERLGARRVLLTSSCTAALEIAALLADLGPGDEVIMPSFTFVATASAVVRTGATPVFVDIRPDTLNLDERLVERAINERTRALLPVHHAGVACDLTSLGEIAAKYQLTIIEDAAQGVAARYRGQALGTIGALGCFSFHETKSIHCGIGGALCVNRPEWVERAEMILDRGTDRAQFARGEVRYYSWTDIGSTFAPSEITCAFLFAQLEQLDEITARRRAQAECYAALLAPLAERGEIELPRTPAECDGNGQTFCLLLPTAADRDGLIAFLRTREIQAVFHYVPLHHSPMGRRFGVVGTPLPVTESVSARAVRLPLFHDLSAAQQEQVVDAVFGYAQRLRRRRAA